MKSAAEPPRASSRRFLTGLLGAPIAQSAAPAMHERAGDALGRADENAAIGFHLGDDPGTFAFHLQAVERAQVETFAELGRFLSFGI